MLGPEVALSALGAGLLFDCGNNPEPGKFPTTDCSKLQAGTCIEIAGGDVTALQLAANSIDPNTTIVLGSGRFMMKQQLTIRTPGVKLVGQGIDVSTPTAPARPRAIRFPARNDCQTCHARKLDAQSPVEIVPMGIKARHLNRTYDYGDDLGSRNQLDHLGEAGMLQGAPGAATVPAAYDFRPVEASGISAIAANDLDDAARSYLDINCAHCHSLTGIQGMTSQLFLNHDSTDVFRLGVCKQPGSAGPGNGGLTYDIVPALHQV